MIQHFVSKILEYGIVPPERKTSCIVPIPKKGNFNLAENYRGIALQSTIPKLFRKNRSTVTNLLHITDFIHEQFSKGNQVDVIYFDFTRAFDTLQHSILAEKLATYSTPFFVYNAIIQFVINRNYILKINGIPTQHSFVTQSAVPQECHCGPVLFTLMAADISTITSNTSIFQLGYADDSKF